MEVSIEDIRILARRCRLLLSDAELQKYANDLAALEELSTALLPFCGPAEEMAFSVGLNGLRADTAENSYPVADMLANASVREGNCFCVPRVIEEAGQ